MSEWRQELVERLAALQLEPEREAEIVEELSQHLDDRVSELVSGGATPDTARAAALADLDVPGELGRRLGEIVTRPALRLPPPGAPARGRWLSGLWQDVRYAVVSLRRTPTFTLTVVAALALTIGPTTAILSVANWLIWRPPPGVVEPHRLAVVWFGDWRDDGAVSPQRVSALNLADLEHASQSAAGVAGWQEGTVSIAADGIEPRRAGSAHATANFFDLIAVRPAAGRAFVADDDQPPFGSPVTIVSDSLARSAFGGPADAVGRSITLNGRRMSVVGVLPPGFVGMSPFSQVDVWFPSATYYHVNHFSDRAMQARQGRGTSGIFYSFIVRLAPNATSQALQAELDVLVPALAERFPGDNEAFKTTRARVFPGLGINELSRERYRSLVSQLLAVGGVLLLLGCANVGNLLISKGVRRHHERAVRVALGASRGRLVQLLLTESCVLAVAGATLGVALAVWLKQLIQTLLLTGVAGTADLAVPMDVRVLLATLGLSITCGLLAGLAPAWMGSSGRIGRDLGRNDLRTATRGTRLRAGLAVTQLALSLALVTNAMLLVATLRNLSAVDLGFDPRGVSVHAINLAGHGYTPDRAMAYDHDLLDRLSSDAALQATALSTGYPPGYALGTRILDPHGDGRATIDVGESYITDGYFRTLGHPLVGGRTFTRTEVLTPPDPANTPVVVGETLARRLFGETNPLGQRVKRPPSRAEQQELLVVGIARDTRDVLTGRPDLMLYLPFSAGAAFASVRPAVLVRSERPIAEVARLVQAHATRIDPALPLAQPRPLSAGIERQLANRRVFAWVLSLLGALGFVLAAVGLYGLLAQMVNERTREFGIRMAIGADRTHVFGLVLKQASWIAGLGCAAGLGLAALGSRMVEAQLVGVTRLEPWIYAASAIALAAIVFAATVAPARTATRIEPVEALRVE